MRLLSKVVKKIPAVNKFIRFHNPKLKDLLEAAKVFNSCTPIIIDIGANTGQTIDFFLNHYPQAEIHSFEPTSNLVRLLQSKYEKHKNVHIYDVALSDTTGKTELFVSEHSPTNSLFRPDVNLYQKFGSKLSQSFNNLAAQECETITFSHFFQAHLIDKTIDLVKIDVQGAEYNVINGGTNVFGENVKAVTLELQYINFYEKSKLFFDVAKLLDEHNFFLFSFFGSNKKPNLQLLENNALFLNKKYFDVLI